uniref:BTB domain-containing protein n=1 Tax=Zonotrichia albicollis TaxID=44394 RepID=A0A8D2QK25_ZONAL
MQEVLPMLGAVTSAGPGPELWGSTMDRKAEEKRKQRHSLALLEQVKSMKECTQIIDVVLVAEGQKFPCHKVVLAAFSAYFRAMFTCGLAECTQREVVLHDVSAESVSVILHYVYSAELRLTGLNVQTVALATQGRAAGSRVFCTQGEQGGLKENVTTKMRLDVNLQHVKWCLLLSTCLVCAENTQLPNIPLSVNKLAFHTYHGERTCPGHLQGVTKGLYIYSLVCLLLSCP